MIFINLQKTKEKITHPFINTYLFKFYTLLKKKIRNRNKNKTFIKSINGIKYELQLNQLIDYNLYYNRYFEKSTSLAIENMVKSGMTVFDIGANIGCHTLPIAKKIGDKGIVYAFEPMEWALKKLHRNIGLNDYKNIVIKNIGLSDKTEIVNINFQTSWTTDNSIVKDSLKTQDVIFNTIDEFIKDSNITNIDLIKIDVDGFEPKVFAGAINCLTNLKPTLILEFVENKEQLVSFLSKYGYKFYSEYDYTLLLDPVKENNTNNIIVIHESKTNNYKFLINK